MTECECLAACPFFNDKMEKMSAIADMYKKQYCLGNNEKCARHLIFDKLGKEKVPPDLYPNQLNKANKILADAR